MVINLPELVVAELLSLWVAHMSMQLNPTSIWQTPGPISEYEFWNIAVNSLLKRPLVTPGQRKFKPRFWHLNTRITQPGFISYKSQPSLHNFCSHSVHSLIVFWILFWSPNFLRILGVCVPLRAVRNVCNTVSPKLLGKRWPESVTSNRISTSDVPVNGE